MPRQPKPDSAIAQLVPDVDWTLDLPEEQRAIVMAERELTVLACHHLMAPIVYCLPRQDKPLGPDESEQSHKTDADMRVWIDDTRKQRLNGLLYLQLGVLEVRFYGPDTSLNKCFFAAATKLGLSTRYAFGRASRDFATSILFKLREDEVERLDDEYVAFKPRGFVLDDIKRGIAINHSPPAKKGNAKVKATLAPGSMLWHEDGVNHDLFKWRLESGHEGTPAKWRTKPAEIEFFAIVRAAAFASILNIITIKAWEGYGERRSFCEWLARVVLAGEATNANIVFSRSARAVIADPKHAELLIALICENKAPKDQVDSQREDCLALFKLARRRLQTDPTTITVAGWAIMRERFGEEAHTALRTVTTVGADSTLLEDFAERYLFCDGEFIDRKAFREGREQFVFSKDDLALKHAPDQILTKKKPVKAFPIFVESKLRQDVTGMELHPDRDPGAILRITRQGAFVANDDYAPEHSRLIFNQWAGLYIRPAKTIDDELKVECERRLNQMLTWVARTPERIAWIKAHMGWTLKHPGHKQQVALVCTGGQGTGKTFLCKDFAHAIFDQYATVASVKALDEQFYIPSYVGTLWVNHDEVVSKSDNIQTIKELIRSDRVSGQFKGQDVRVHAVYARLAFTSNETNPGLSRGELDRGLFQVTSISPATMNMLPSEFERWTGANCKPFYAEFDAFLKRNEVREAYVRLLMDCAPATVAEVENIEHSATVEDKGVVGAQLTPAQQIAREILADGTIWGGWDIAMPFHHHHLMRRIRTAAKDMSISAVPSPEAILDLFYDARILRRPVNGERFMFDYKIGGLIRLFGESLRVPFQCHWPLDPAIDDMPNDYRSYEDLVPWKGRGK